MVAAAVAARVTASRIASVEGIGFAESDGEPTLAELAELIDEAVAALPEPQSAPVIAERGEFYEESTMRVEGHLGREFKYVESIAERETVAIAHHAAYAARTLLI